MRILFVTARPPWPGRRGDQMRTAGLVQELARRHTVRILSQRWPGFPPAPEAGPPAGVELRTVPVAAPRILLGLRSVLGRPIQVALHHHRAFRQAVRHELGAFRPEVVVLVLSRIGDVLEELREVPVVVDLIDALALNMTRRAGRQRWLRFLWSWEAERMARWDRRTIRRCQQATVVAERDRRALVVEEAELAAKVRVVPLGLRPPPAEPLAVARQPIVALTGNLGYFPTVDGARWFAREVWPRIRRLEPRAQWWLAGARPARSVRRLAKLEGVRLYADPDDLLSISHRAAVAVAPLWSGSGTPIKILEAMALSVPVVTTRSGAAGLDGLPSDAVETAERPETFSRAVVRLLKDRDLARRQCLAARRWLQMRHDPELVGRDFEGVLGAAIRRFGG